MGFLKLVLHKSEMLFHFIYLLRVAVKVIHPSARAGIQRDLRVLELAQWLELLLPSLKYCSLSDSVRHDLISVYL
jgi:predicted unusual protein kinase regulating ubiquinone biosynthesis (AarF/ABC1/UbiB family)